jgi:hypothetical protein
LCEASALFIEYFLPQGVKGAKDQRYQIPKIFFVPLILCPFAVKLFFMPLLSRRKILPIFFLLLILAGIWIFFQRISSVAMDTYVPDSALGFVVVNDVPQVINNLTSTQGWKDLAPAYGLDGKFGYAGWLATLGRWTGLGTAESLLISRGQFALVITGIELRGDEVKPRWALVAETHGSESSVKSLISERVAQLATRAYKNPIQESSEYEGVPISIFRAPAGEQSLLTAHIKSEWILANNPEALRACIDTRMGRTPAVSTNKLLPAARQAVDQDGEVFAFVSKQGSARIAQFFSHLYAGKLLEATPLTGLLESLVSDISNGMMEGMTYSATFERGAVTDQYAVLCKPDVAEGLKAAMKISSNTSPEKSALLKQVPVTVGDVAWFNLQDPSRSIESFEKMVTTRIGVAQSFLFHRFFTSAKKIFLGLEQGENGSSAIGSEVVRVIFPEHEDEPVWIATAVEKTATDKLAMGLISHPSTNLKRENYKGLVLKISGDNKKAFTLMDQFLVYGSSASLKKFIDEKQRNSAWVQSPKFTTASAQLEDSEGALLRYRSVAEESAKMMNSFRKKLNIKVEDTSTAVAEKLPFAASRGGINDSGFHITSRSAFGNFPLVASFIDSVF